MNQAASNREPKFGFLSIFEIPTLGFCGGLLVLSAKGRPLEFHCTTPTSANEAQRILYGQTLRPFLFCDQIGQALIQKARANLDLIVSANREITGLNETFNIPVVWLPELEEKSTQSVQSETSPQADSPNTIGSQIAIREQTLQIVTNSAQDLERVENLVRDFVETLPLIEPFERIQQAISAAHKVAA